MDKFSELKAAAMAATPGPWFRSSVQFNGITTEATFITQGNKPHVASASEKRDAIFIAAANPAAVLALLAELEASKKSNAFLKEQLAKLANFNPDWDMLEACRESWREVAAALKEAEAKLEAKDKCIAEAEVRGVEKLAAAFKSWASDETFPDCEAQRHWATASQEALSFAGDLRNGSCDDR